MRSPNSFDFIYRIAEGRGLRIFVATLVATFVAPRAHFPSPIRWERVGVRVRM
jgi:hypothetical protein